VVDGVSLGKRGKKKRREGMKFTRPQERMKHWIVLTVSKWEKEGGSKTWREPLIAAKEDVPLIE